MLFSFYFMFNDNVLSIINMATERPKKVAVNVDWHEYSTECITMYKFGKIYNLNVIIFTKF